VRRTRAHRAPVGVARRGAGAELGAVGHDGIGPCRPRRAIEAAPGTMREIDARLAAGRQ